MPGPVQGQPAVRDEGVAAQPFDVDRPDGDARQVRVAPDEIEVVDGEDAGQQRLEPADPARHRVVHERGLGDEERDPARVDGLAGREPVPLGHGARRPAQPAQQRPELVLDDPARQVLVGQPLPVRPSRVGRRLEVGQDMVVEEVGERPVPDVVEEPGHPQGLDRQALRRDRLVRVRERRPQARVERPCPEARLVHDPEAVGEPRVLGGREDPAGALELADAAQPLEPRRVEQVLLGGLLGGQPCRRRLVACQPLGQLHVPVDRVADEVDRGERLAAHVGQGTQIRSSFDHGPTFPALSVARTRRPYQCPGDTVTVREVVVVRGRTDAHDPLPTRASTRYVASPAVCVWSGASAPVHRQVSVRPVRVTSTTDAVGRETSRPSAKTMDPKV